MICMKFYFGLQYADKLQNENISMQEAEIFRKVEAYYSSQTQVGMSVLCQ